MKNPSMGLIFNVYKDFKLLNKVRRLRLKLSQEVIKLIAGGLLEFLNISK